MDPQVNVFLCYESGCVSHSESWIHTIWRRIVASGMLVNESKTKSYAIGRIRRRPFPFDFAATSKKSRMLRSLKVSAFVIVSLIFAICSARRLESQSTSTPPNSPSVTLPGSQSPFLGSAPEGTAIPEVLPIDFKDAIDRGLRNNLGLLLSSDQTIAARGERWHQLAELLPNIGI